MPTFISEISFTQQGMKDIKSTCQRAAAFRAMAKAMGVDVRDIYWTQGPFDGILVLDAPDDQTASALMLQLGSFGNVQTRTARAYNESEIQEVLNKMSG